VATSYSQPGIFNVLDYGMLPGSSVEPSANQGFLQTAINDAIAAGGGTVLIPSEFEIDGVPVSGYNIVGPINIGTADSPGHASVLIVATSQDTGSATPLLYVFGGTVSEPTPYNGDLFSVYTTASGEGGEENIGGTNFENLNITYYPGASVPSGGTAAAIHVVDGQNVRVMNTVILNAPQGVFFDNTLQCNLFQCTIYNATTPGTALTLGSGISNVAKETYVAGCTFLSYKPSAGLGIAVQINSVEHVRMQNVRLEGYQQGIVITPGASAGGDAYHLHFGDVTCHTTSAMTSSGAAVLIQPYSPHAVARVTFEDCDLSQGQGKTATSYIGPGIVLDPVTGGGVIDQVRFVDTRSFLWPGAGMQIEGGTNIEVLGGYYSCNGIASGSDEVIAAGIAITGATTGVRITGAACNNSVYIIGKNQFISDSGFAPATQEYGIYVGGSASGIRVANCDLTGNLDYGLVVTGAAGTPAGVFINHCDVTGYTGTSQAPVSVTTPVSNLQITDCPGYNDQAVQLSRPPTPPPISGETFYNRTFGYYGPISFLVWGGVVSEITIGAIITNLASGSFMLAPNAGASVTYSAVNPSFGAVGM
jgi:hypothetical protein